MERPQSWYFSWQPRLECLRVRFLSLFSNNSLNSSLTALERGSGELNLTFPQKKEG